MDQWASSGYDHFNPGCTVGKATWLLYTESQHHHCCNYYPTHKPEAQTDIRGATQMYI